MQQQGAHYQSGGGSNDGQTAVGPKKKKLTLSLAKSAQDREEKRKVALHIGSNLDQVSPCPLAFAVIQVMRLICNLTTTVGNLVLLHLPL